MKALYITETKDDTASEIVFDDGHRLQIDEDQVPTLVTPDGESQNYEGGIEIIDELLASPTGLYDLPVAPRNYRVTQTYIPDDETEPTKTVKEFQCNTTDTLELALAARAACIGSGVTEGLRDAFERDCVADQLQELDTDYLFFLCFANSGEWELEVEAIE